MHAMPGLAMPAFLGTHPVTGKPILPAGDAKTVAASALTGAIATGEAAAGHPCGGQAAARPLGRL